MENRNSVEYSRAVNEPLYGTIKPANLWFLLEYNGVYTHDVWKDSRIPSEVKSLLDSMPKSRSILIRQPNQVNAIDRKISFFVINAIAPEPYYYHLFLQEYEDILNIDFEALLAGKLTPSQTEALYLVCTNGKRDVCCSQYGVALYNALINEAVDNVWQCSHIGGHRFAGTMFCFPFAICYGFLTEKDAEAVVQSYNQERLLLNKLRGHAIYPQPVQVAEYHLRYALNNTDFDALKLLKYETAEKQWIVEFAVYDKPYEVKIAEAELLMVLSTTGDAELSPVQQFKLIEYKAL